MNPEVYTQDMRANHKLCPYCGMWHTSMSCAPQFAGQSMRIVELESEIASLRSELERVKAESEWIPCEVRMPDGKRNLLVTNNLEARDVFGEMSHIWLVTNIYAGENGKYSAFDESMQRIHGIKYWRYALPATPVTQ